MLNITAAHKTFRSTTLYLLFWLLLKFPYLLLWVKARVSYLNCSGSAYVEIKYRGVRGLHGQGTLGRWRCNFRWVLTDQSGSYLSPAFKGRRAAVIRTSCAPHSWPSERTRHCVRNTRTFRAISGLRAIVNFLRGVVKAICV